MPLLYIVNTTTLWIHSHNTYAGNESSLFLSISCCVKWHFIMIRDIPMVYSTSLSMNKYVEIKHYSPGAGIYPKQWPATNHGVGPVMIKLSFFSRESIYVLATLQAMCRVMSDVICKHISAFPQHSSAQISIGLMSGQVSRKEVTQVLCDLPMLPLQYVSGDDSACNEHIFTVFYILSCLNTDVLHRTCWFV